MDETLRKSRIQSYRDLAVWQRAVKLTLTVYRLTESFPKEERFGLTSQLRRAAVSIATNIAEGHARNTRGEYKNQISVARGSTREVEVLLHLAELLRFATAESLVEPLDDCDAISRMITKLKRAL